MRRVVVTGLGAVTPLGVGKFPLPSDSEATELESLNLPLTGVRRTWTRILNGDCGIVSTRPLGSQFAAIPSQVAAIVPEGSKSEGGWTAVEHVSKGVSSSSDSGDIHGISSPSSGSPTNGKVCPVRSGCRRRGSERCILETDKGRRFGHDGGSFTGFNIG